MYEPFDPAAVDPLTIDAQLSQMVDEPSDALFVQLAAALSGGHQRKVPRDDRGMFPGTLAP